jgi:membrane-bound serine protease (ClpP class)
LLSLTANEAVKAYGTPPQPLLGAGIAADLPALHRMLAGSGEFVVRDFKMTWSLDLAVWLMNLSPLLLGIGGLLLAIEFKTPGFGWVGISGIALILIVIFGHNVAGLSGHEAMLFFLLGVALVFVEILVYPGVIVFGALGLLIMIGSMLWGMADIWPQEVEGVSLGTFYQPAYTLSLGVLIAMAMFFAVLKFLPKTSIWNRLVLSADIHASAGTAANAATQAGGEIGTVVSPLRPTGTIDIGGQRFEARCELGEIAAGVQVRVVRRADFVLIVEPVKS